MANQDACAKLCSSTDGALFWTFQTSTKYCWLKTSKGTKFSGEDSDYVSGNKECGKQRKSNREVVKNFNADFTVRLIRFISLFLGILQQINGEDCWSPCGGRAGKCEDFCGPSGFCCRRDWTDSNGEAGCPLQLAKQASDKHHTCVREGTCKIRIQTVKQ